MIYRIAGSLNWRACQIARATAGGGEHMSREITVDLFHLDDLSAILGAYLDELKEKKRQIVQNTAEAIRDKAQEKL